MNEHQIRPEVVSNNRQATFSQEAANLRPQASGHPMPGNRKFVRLHASEANYIDWVLSENKRLLKQNDQLRGLLLKATHELKTSNPACAEMLATLTPARHAPNPNATIPPRPSSPT
jgi:hypothetical protein